MTMTLIPPHNLQENARTGGQTSKEITEMLRSGDLRHGARGRSRLHDLLGDLGEKENESQTLEK